MKKKILFGLNYFWCAFVAYAFPFYFRQIWQLITDFFIDSPWPGSAKALSLFGGIVELYIGLSLSVPFYLLLILKLKQSPKLYQILTICLFGALMLIRIQVMGGWTEYLEAFRIWR